MEASEITEIENPQLINQAENNEPLPDDNPFTQKLRRSSRKRIRSISPPRFREAKLLKLKESSSLKDIQNYYLDTKIKRLNPSLETIFEEPQIVNNQEVLMSSRKFKRLIAFNPAGKNDPKSKRRKQKARTVQPKKPKKVPLKVLMDKLKEIDD